MTNKIESQKQPEKERNVKIIKLEELYERRNATELDYRGNDRS